MYEDNGKCIIVLSVSVGHCASFFPKDPPASLQNSPTLRVLPRCARHFAIVLHRPVDGFGGSHPVMAVKTPI